jgi:hypothetical protein
MRPAWLMLAVLLAGPMWSRTEGQPLPQTARQALIEMFFGKAPGSFQKHLPAATRAAIYQVNPNQGPFLLQAFSSFGSQLAASGQRLEVFDAGPILLVTQDPRTQSKFEIIVESDDLRGDEDAIELSFKAYKEGQEQIRGVMPRFMFLMKQEGKPESSVWTLNEITFSLRVPLADPDFLKGITESMKRAQASPATFGDTSTHVSDGAAVTAMRAIMTAETTYAATYTAHGYTCLLSDLDGFGGDQPDEHQAMLIESRLASGKKFGYTFTLTGCSGQPATAYQLTAVPTPPAGGRAYCADRTGVIRYSDDGTSASCWATGKPLP